MGTSKNVATHPVAQLKQEDIPLATPLQSTHRSLSLRTRTFHTTYDGDGKRVKKIAYNSTGTEIETTLFVYDASGKQIAEYSDVVANSGDAKVAYLTSDNLGSTRINTNASGGVISRHDYHPFGEEVSTSQRTVGLGYANDTVRKKFTGYERDDETGLDFAQARYLNANLGRFSSADPVFISLDRVLSPQMLNLYAYAVNSPLRYTDPEGEEIYELGQDALDKLEKDKKALEKQLKADPKDQALAGRLAKLKADIAIVKSANAEVGAWLKAGQARGELSGVKLSDIKFSTDPPNDLPSVAGNREDIREYQTMIRSDEATTGETIGSQIYVFGTSQLFAVSSQVTSGKIYGTSDGQPVPKSDIDLVGAGFLVHERKHVSDNAAGKRVDELGAYDAEINFLDRNSKSFKNQTYLNEAKANSREQRKIYEPKR